MDCQSASPTEVRNNAFNLMDAVVENHQPLRIHLKGAEDVVMIS